MVQLLVDANIWTCLFRRERELCLDAGRNVPKAAEGGFVARAMAHVIPARWVALIHHVKWRVVDEQALALTIVAVRAVVYLVTRFADAGFDGLDPVDAP